MYRPINPHQLRIAYWYPDGSTLCANMSRIANTNVRVWLLDENLDERSSAWVDSHSRFIQNLSNITYSEVEWARENHDLDKVTLWYSGEVLRDIIGMYRPYNPWCAHVPKTIKRREREVFASGGRLYSVPIALSDMFAPPCTLATLTQAKRMRLAMFVLREIMNIDIARVIVLMCCELFRTLDYAKYSMQV